MLRKWINIKTTKNVLETETAHKSFIFFVGNVAVVLLQASKSTSEQKYINSNSRRDLWNRIIPPNRTDLFQRDKLESNSFFCLCKKCPCRVFLFDIMEYIAAITAKGALLSVIIGMTVMEWAQGSAECCRHHQSNHNHTEERPRDTSLSLSYQCECVEWKVFKWEKAKRKETTFILLFWQSSR